MYYCLLVVVGTDTVIIVILNNKTNTFYVCRLVSVFSEICCFQLFVIRQIKNKISVKIF